MRRQTEPSLATDDSLMLTLYGKQWEDQWLHKQNMHINDRFEDLSPTPKQKINQGFGVE